MNTEGKVSLKGQKAEIFSGFFSLSGSSVSWTDKRLISRHKLPIAHLKHAHQASISYHFSRFD